jgi:hypothetical protein
MQGSEGMPVLKEGTFSKAHVLVVGHLQPPFGKRRMTTTLIM